MAKFVTYEVNNITGDDADDEIVEFNFGDNDAVEDDFDIVAELGSDADGGGDNNNNDAERSPEFSAKEIVVYENMDGELSERTISSSDASKSPPDESRSLIQVLYSIVYTTF